MKIAPLAQVKDQFSSFIEACKKSPVIVTKNGKPVAMLISIRDEEDIESLLLANHPRFMQVLEEGYKSAQESGGIKSDTFWKEVKQRRGRKE